MTEWSSLLDAIDELTLPQRRKERQDVLEAGKVVGQQAVTIVDDSLLAQLAEAVAGAVGSGSSKGSLAFERNVLDFDSLFKLVKITETIIQWCAAFKVKPSKDPAADLRAWYVASRAKNLEPAVEDFYTKQCRKWAGEIRSRMDPWRERELTNEACPVCDSSVWWKDGDKFAHPLVVKYKETGADLIQQARGMCRACATIFGVRELAFAIEQRHEAAESAEGADKAA